MTAPTRVYAWCNARWQPFGDQVWVAIAEDGDVLATHISSGRSWGQHDVGPHGMHQNAYAAKFGDDFLDRIEYVVLPEGETPPDEVYERNQQQAESEANHAE